MAFLFDLLRSFPPVLLLSIPNGVVMLNFLRGLDVVWKAPDDKSVELTPIRWLIVPHQKYEALFIKRPLLLVITLCLLLLLLPYHASLLWTMAEIDTFNGKKPGAVELHLQNCNYAYKSYIFICIARWRCNTFGHFSSITFQCK